MQQHTGLAHGDNLNLSSGREKKKCRDYLFFSFFFSVFSWRVFVLAVASRPPAAPQLQPANGSTRRCDMYYAKVGRVDTSENRRLQSPVRLTSALVFTAHRWGVGGGAGGVVRGGLGGVSGFWVPQVAEQQESKGGSPVVAPLRWSRTARTYVYVHVSSRTHEVLLCTFAFNPPFYPSTSFKEKLGKAVRALSRLDPLTSA